MPEFGPSHDEAMELNEEPSITTYQLTIEDKENRPYKVDYFSFPLGNEVALADPRIQELIPGIIEVTREAFPHYKDDLIGRLSRFEGDQAFSVIRTEEGKIVGYNIYRLAELEGYEQPVKVVYTHFAATRPDFESKGISTRSREAMLAAEDPTVVCGSSANGGVYVANKRIADARGLAFYPTEQPTPHEIYGLAVKIHDKLSLHNAELDERLVRTYSGATSRGKGTHPLEHVLPLNERQHIFYLMLKPEFNEEIKNTSS